MGFNIVEFLELHGFSYVPSFGMGGQIDPNQMVYLSYRKDNKVIGITYATVKHDISEIISLVFRENSSEILSAEHGFNDEVKQIMDKLSCDGFVYERLCLSDVVERLNPYNKFVVSERLLNDTFIKLGW
jgi:hypothetical protein